ncbi:MAG: DNA polymerase III subunit alpha [Pseudomonadota bacterium]
MAKPSFIHLAVRSSYSLLESMITPKSLADWAVTERMPALAVADRNNMFGALEISELLSGAGVQPIVACCFDLGDAAPRNGTHRVSLYAQNDAGYRRLMRLSSLAYLEAGDGVPRLNPSHLMEDTEGLILLTGGVGGEVSQWLLKGKRKAAQETLEGLAAAYPGRIYVELTRHGEAAEAEVEPGLISLAYEVGLPLVATHDARFMAPSDAHAHDAMMCISHGRYLGEDDRPKVAPGQWLKTANEMCALFADLPEALDSTVEIARRCAVKSERHAPILPRFAKGEMSEIEALKQAATEGLAVRLDAADCLYGERDAYHSRLDHELAIIERMGFPGYFLIVSDFIKWAKAQGIPVGPGRGSGAGSLVAWALLITDLDPLRFDLLFERFLNPERISMPDFDVDFCQERRGEVIRYVRDKYGADSVAMIITFGTLQAKAVVRDVGRVMQMRYGQVDRLAKLIPFDPANPPKLAEAIAGEPKFEEEIEQDERVGALLDTALQLEGLPRSAGTHAAGVVIADRPLTEIAPLYNDPRSDLPATQFNMMWAENAGLVKFDFLGLKTLTVIEKALGFVRRGGQDVCAKWRTFDDGDTYELLASGETLGVFQLEGQGMRDTLKKVRPGNIEDIIAIISLYRPGPMDNIPVYVQGKENPGSIRYDHPDLEPILAATYGVPVYQEQVMRMAQEIAGYSLGEADLLRRAMGKKKKAEMAKQRARFVDGAADRKGINGPLADSIFDTMAKFAGYGFNKSHAAAYAVIGYQTGYLKRHFPVEFLAASMSLDLHNTDKLAAFFQEARRLSIEVVAPDINRSTADFDVGDGAIIYALGALKGVGVEAMRHVEHIRGRDGAFESLHDFAERVDPRHINKKALEQLSKAGAFDALEPSRARALAAAPVLTSEATRAADDRAGGQGGLFGAEESGVRAPLPEAKAWNGQQKLDEEFRSIGFYLSGHPLDDILSNIDRGRVTLAHEIEDKAVDGRALELIGVVRARVEKPGRKGGKFAFLTLSDPTGEVELMVYPETLAEKREQLGVGDAVAVTASVRRNGEEIRLAAENVKPIIDANLSRRSATLTVRIGPSADFGDLAAITKVLEARGGSDRGVLNVEIILDDGRLVTLSLEGRYPTDIAAVQALKSAPGVDQVIAA